jgi:hypothetical protein
MRRYWRPRITTFGVTLAVGQIGEVIPAATSTLCAAPCLEQRPRRSRKAKPRAAIGLILRTLNALGILLDARSEPAQKAKPSAHEVDLDALIEAARKPRS